MKYFCLLSWVIDWLCKNCLPKIYILFKFHKLGNNFLWVLFNWTAITLPWLDLLINILVLSWVGYCWSVSFVSVKFRCSQTSIPKLAGGHPIYMYIPLPWRVSCAIRNSVCDLSGSRPSGSLVSDYKYKKTLQMLLFSLKFNLV